MTKTRVATVFGVLSCLALTLLLCGCPAPGEGTPTTNGTTNTTSDTTPPGEVTSLTATAGVQQVVLTWHDPGDADFSKVQVTWTPGGSTPVEVGKGTQTSTCSGLTGGQSYTFTVKTVDNAGNVSAGTTATATAAILDVTAPSLSVTNLRNNGVLASGFVVGTATDNVGVTAVEVSVDGGAWQTASGTTTWSFGLPNGASTWLLGTLHTVSARAKDSVANVSSTASFSVRRGINKDVDGDGFPDMVISSYGYNANAGRVWLYKGSASGPSTTAAQHLDGSANDSLGWAVALGDFNGDGYADLAAGAVKYSTYTGRVLVFNGSAAGLATSPSTTLTGPATNSNFGDALACGDANKDGYADLAVGANGYSSNAGEVCVYHGSSAGLVTTPARTLSGSASAGFGRAVAFGDVNADGYSDLAVGAPNTTNGSVYVYHGSSTGISGSATRTLTGGASGDGFGHSVSLGDANGDGYSDLAVGAYYYSTMTGRAYVYHGSGSGIAAAATTTVTGAATGYYFGVTVAIGDLNGDGYGDLAVTADAYNSYTGRVYIYNASASGVGTSISKTLDGEATSSFYGEMLVVDDMNLDGYGDLFVGAPNHEKGYLYAGSATGVPSTVLESFTESSTSYYGAGADF